MKLSLEDIAHVLHQRKDLAPQVITEIVKDLEAVAKEEKEQKEAEKEKAAGKEKPYLVLVATGGVDAPLDPNNTPFFVLESAAEFGHDTVVSRLAQATIAYNTDVVNRRGKKRKKHKRQMVETIGEAVAAVPSTMLKPHGLKIKSKEPVILVRADNDLNLSNQPVPAAEEPPTTWTGEDSSDD